MNPIFIGSNRDFSPRPWGCSSIFFASPKGLNASAFVLIFQAEQGTLPSVSYIFLSPTDLAAASLAVRGSLAAVPGCSSCPYAFSLQSHPISRQHPHLGFLELSLPSMEDGLLDSHSLLQCFRNLFSRFIYAECMALFKNWKSKATNWHQIPMRIWGIFRWENVIVFKFLLAGLVTERPWGLVGKTSALESKLGQYCYFH